MIARPEQCDPARLAHILDDSLALDEQFSLTQHLDHCETCRTRLELLTAESSWWQDTKDVLSEMTELQSLTTCGSDDAASASEPSPSSDLTQPIEAHWVLDLLESSSEGDALGAVDSMPVESVIGQGGMGVVLKARDHDLHRFLAIKLLSPMLANVGAARQRFLREAQAAAAVVHPNIVPIYAVSAERKLPYLVMPFIGGGNLQQFLNDHGPLPIERVLSIGLQVAEGLAAAHRQGIVHRDIKPANLLLDEGGFRVMLTDFGLARALDDATLTGSGMLAGTPQFMSPEQARGEPVDHRSDIYSLGSVLYALATGRPPVRGDSTLDILRRIGEDRPTAVIDIDETIPKWFQSLIERLMAKELSARTASAEDAAELIRGCLAHARSPHKVALPEELKPTLREALLAVPKRKVIVAVVAVLLSAILLISLFAPDRSGRNTTGDTGHAATNTVGAEVPNEEAFDKHMQEGDMQDGNMQDRTHTQFRNGEFSWEAAALERSLSQSELELQMLKSEIDKELQWNESQEKTEGL